MAKSVEELAIELADKLRDSDAEIDRARTEFISASKQLLEPVIDYCAALAPALPGNRHITSTENVAAGLDAFTLTAALTSGSSRAETITFRVGRQESFIRVSGLPEGVANALLRNGHAIRQSEYEVMDAPRRQPKGEIIVRPESRRNLVEALHATVSAYFERAG